MLALAKYLRDPLGALPAYAKEYGATFTFPGNPPLVLSGDPAMIHAIYSADPDSLEPLSHDMGEVLGRSSVILLSGTRHRAMRKLLAPPFHGARMRAYGAQIVALARERAARLEVGANVSMLELAQKISLDVILQTIFGVTEPGAMREFGDVLRDLTNNISPLIALFPSLRREFGGVGPYAAFLRRRKRLYEALDRLIEAARASGPREDVLSLLVAARYDDGAPMSDDEVRDQLVILCFAGYETTAITLAWAMYALHRPDNAECLTRLREELRASEDAEPESVAKLPYLDAVCQETLRLYPIAPAPSPRRLLRPLTLGAYELPAGTGVGVAIGLVHYREDLYPEPLRFRPERFLERRFSAFEHVPWGGGARRCLGAALAHYELKLVLATLLRKTDFRLASSAPERASVRAANVGPKRGVRMIVERVER